MLGNYEHAVTNLSQPALFFKDKFYPSKPSCRKDKMCCTLETRHLVYAGPLEALLYILCSLMFLNVERFELKDCIYERKKSDYMKI